MDSPKKRAEVVGSAGDPYRVLFEQSADAILIIDGDTFVDCNQATVDMLRYDSKDELLRTHPSELSPPQQPDGRDSYEKANEIIAIAFEQGSHRFEWDHKRADGTVFPVEVLLTAVPVGGKTLLHVVWRDITERKRLEQELQQKQKMEAIGKLAGGIAHDFNNLLVAIVGNAELMQREIPAGSPLRECAAEIQAAAERAAELTGQLLAFSRKSVRQPRVIDLGAVLARAEKLLNRLIGEDVRLAVQWEQDLRVVVDPGQIEQVVMNLAANARDATSSGGTITLEASVAEVGEGRLALPPGRYACLRVTDHGTGMTGEIAEKAFDPFFTTKGVGGGTGLGLSTVYGIVKQSQGDLTLETAPGVGTTIRVYLPLTDQLVSEVRELPDSVDVSGGTERVLVVEDESVVRTLVSRVLREHGYSVLVASDGVEALDLYRQHHAEIDLVFSDVVMPEMGGPEMVDNLEREGFAPRVLFASGYMDSTVAKLDAWRTDVDLLLKPFSPQELLLRVRRSLDRKTK